MQQDYKQIVVGTNTSIDKPWFIAGILVDNPSDSWLYIEPIRKYIPPHTIGWSANIAPVAYSIQIKFVAAPAGGVTSVNTGGPVVVRVFDTEIGETTGLDYTTATKVDIAGLQTQIVTLQTKIDNLKAGYGTLFAPLHATGFIALKAGSTANVVLIAAPGANLRIYIVACELMAESKNNSLPFPGYAPAGLWRNSPSEEIDRFMLCASDFQDRHEYAPGSMTGNTNDSIKLQSNGTLASANYTKMPTVSVTAFIDYYIAA